jgi:hypothetical protein
MPPKAAGSVPGPPANSQISLIYIKLLLHLGNFYAKLSLSSSMFNRLPARDLSPIAIIIAVIVAGPA